MITLVKWSAIVHALLLAGISVLAACAAPAPKLPADTSPAAVRDLLTGSDGARFLRDITLYEWPDDGKRAGELFGWIAKDSGSSDPTIAARAGETAHALAAFLGHNADELISIHSGRPRRDQTSAGQRNPALIQAYAAALIPYQGPMVGESAGTRGFEPLEPMETSMQNTRNLFAVIDTDNTAGQRFTDAARQRATMYQRNFASLAAADPKLANTDPRQDDLNAAARLLGLTQAGAIRSGDSDKTLLEGHAVAQARYQIASVLVHGADPRIDPQFFNADAALMPPEDVLSKFGQASWNRYSDQLDTYLSQYPVITNAVNDFRSTFATIVGAAPHPPSR